MILERLVGPEARLPFDALSLYDEKGRYSEVMLVDEVPQRERKDLARRVADRVLSTPGRAAARRSRGGS